MQYIRFSETVEIKTIKEDDKFGVFHVEGLYTGYGITLGNALRRIMLSSLPGAAITRIKVKGVNHEFSTIPGVLEDVVEFILNLKKVRFHFLANEPQVLSLKKKGEGPLTADDIKSTATVRVANPELHLATMTKKTAEIEAELTVEKGLGYVQVEESKSERLPVGVVVLDAIFSPVRKAVFKVENIRVGKRTDYNRLILEIETDGTISPSSALRKTANILKDHCEIISNLEVKETALEEGEKKPAKGKSEKKASKSKK